MKKLLGWLAALVVAWPLSGVGGSSWAAAQDGQFFTYRPQVQSLKYDLSITTQSQAVALFLEGPREELQDRISLTQKVERAGDGLLDIALTVDDLNMKEQEPPTSELHLTPRGGSSYERKDIAGNTGHTLINLLGEVKEMRAIPHFGSVYFHPQNLSGPPMDIYPVMSLLYPRFPMRLIQEGESWKVEDEIAIESAQALPIRGLGTLKHELNMTVKRDLEYTLVSFVQRGKYKTAHIRFNGTFSMDGEMITEAGGDYIEGSGKSSGELYFAPDEGLLVEVLIQNEVNEQKSQDGHVVHWFNSELSMAVFFGQPTPAITWLTDQNVHFVLTQTDSKKEGGKR